MIAMRENFAVTRVVDVGRVVYKGADRGDHRRTHGHGSVRRDGIPGKNRSQWFVTLVAGVDRCERL